jgi:ABC-type transporter Mla MlaB component
VPDPCPPAGPGVPATQAGPGVPAPRSAVLVVAGRVTPETIPGLCARVRALLDDPAVTVITLDLSGVVEPDAVALDGLARMQLTARRMGRAIRLRHVRPQMRALLAFAGLTDVIASQPPEPDGAAPRPA